MHFRNMEFALCDIDLESCICKALKHFSYVHDVFRVGIAEDKDIV